MKRTIPHIILLSLLLVALTSMTFAAVSPATGLQPSANLPSATASTPADASSPTARANEYYAPCADLLSKLKAGEFEAQNIQRIEKPEQLVLLLKDYQVLQPDNIRAAILEVLSAQKLLQVSISKYNNRYLWDQPLTDKESEQQIRNLINFAKKSDSDLRPFAWQVLESLKKIAAASGDEGQGQVARVQLTRLIDSMKAKDLTKGVVERLFIDLLRVESVRLASATRGNSLLPIKRSSGFFHFFVDIGLLASAIEIMLKILPPSAANDGGAGSFFVVAPGLLIVAADLMNYAFNDNSPERTVFNRIMHRILNFRSTAKQYNQAVLRYNEGKTEVLAREILGAATTGASTKAPKMQLAITLLQACETDNICNLTYNQIAYAGEADILNLQMLHHRLVDVASAHKVMTGAPQLVEKAKAAAQPEASLRNIIEFRQQLAIAAKHSELENNEILNLVSKIEEMVDSQKVSLRQLKSRPFRFSAQEETAEALNKLELLGTAIKGNVATIDEIELDSTSMRNQIEKSRALTAEIKKIAEVAATTEQEVRAQAEEVLLLVERFNID